MNNTKSRTQRGRVLTWVLELAQKTTARAKLAKALRLASAGGVAGLWGAWQEQAYEVALVGFAFFLFVQVVAFIVEPPDGVNGNAKGGGEA